ncbi:TadE/TadG family type IV pilus assembly protein [Tabrizicola aquatica]|uniref:TadE/TadG family type IV pilus assembly protein n=1 Tax=Tabrizicola aquatica TaxID=909926 RepID=UPI000CD1542E|nr:pilus assembly protein TadE [Tabrizicola aquatica]
MIRLPQSFRRFLSNEDGNPTMEFVLTFPVVIVIFCAAFESSFYMIKSVSLERSLDLVIRDLRLGTLGSISHNQLKAQICSRAAVLGEPADCVERMRIELQPIDTASFAMPTVPNACVDRRQPIDPAVEPSTDEYALGDGNQIMLMRVCFQSEPMFRTTVFGARMNRTGADGNYSLISTSTFVNEPRT